VDARNKSGHDEEGRGRLRNTHIGAALIAVLLVAPMPALAARLVVTVENLRNGAGDLRLSLYTAPAEWPDEAPPEYRKVVPAQAGSVTVEFEVPPGTYALAGFHDENRNEEFDTNFIGIPREGYTFSNGARPGLSAPPFESAAITVPEAGARIVMRMVYW
jgi:uncharacterized protein (DUF2141 family)